MFLLCFNKNINLYLIARYFLIYF